MLNLYSEKLSHKSSPIDGLPPPAFVSTRLDRKRVFLLFSAHLAEGFAPSAARTRMSSRRTQTVSLGIRMRYRKPLTPYTQPNEDSPARRRSRPLNRQRHRGFFCSQHSAKILSGIRCYQIELTALPTNTWVGLPHGLCPSPSPLRKSERKQVMSIGNSYRTSL